MGKKGSGLVVKLDRIDRYKAYLLKDLELTETELKMMERYKQAKGLLYQGFTRQHTVQILQRDFGVSEPQAYAIVRDAVKIYGDATELDRKGLRALMFDNFMLTAQLARKKEDYQAMARAQEAAAKLYNLMTADVEALDISKYQRAQAILFTDDEEALREAKEREMRELSGEDVDFEEVEE